MQADRWTPSRGLFFALAVLLVALLSVPVSMSAGPDTGSATVGSGIYRSYCKSCHGVAGEGDGSLATSLEPRPTDLTVLAKDNGGVFPADRVRQVIDGRIPVEGHLKSEMPVWGTAFAAVEAPGDEAAISRKIGNLVAFIGSIQDDAEK